MNEFRRRFEILALTLGLKRNDALTTLGREGEKNYKILFTTYIKMVKQDRQNFFIDKSKKKEIITSLKNTLTLYQTNSTDEFKKILRDLKPNDPTSFILAPIAYDVSSKTCTHASCFIIYKNEQENFLGVFVNKSNDYVQYTTIPKSNDVNIGEIFIDNRHHYTEKEPFWIIKQIINLSDKREKNTDTNLNIATQRQYIGNCSISNVNAALKIALFNCRKNIFDLSKNEDKITPKWNPPLGSNYQMRKRFLNAISVADKPQWNECFNKAFLHYHYRKLDTMIDSSSNNSVRDTEMDKKKLEIVGKYAKKFAEDKSIHSLKNKLSYAQKQSHSSISPNKTNQPLVVDSR